MSERTKPASLESETAPEVSGVVLGSGGGTSVRLRWNWLKRLLACNPFYLVSAALLLFGMSRMSAAPGFLGTELAQLTFNFSSLQLYELLLVGTAILLARRAVWYDSTLLLLLENLLVLVPFILVSQAAFMQAGLVWTFCGLAVVLVGTRMGAARRFVVGFTPSPRLIAAGLGVLTANAALPVVYRHLHEFKVGTRPTSGAAFEVNEQSWLWLLPVLCALTSLLPHPREDGKLPAQRRWFPVILFFLWLAGTGVHLYSLGYVYDFPLRREWLAPSLCVLAWVIQWRLRDFVAEPAPALRVAALTLPLAGALVAVGAEGSRVGFALLALNAIGFAGVALLDRGHRAARHLLLITLALLVATIPHEWAGVGGTPLGSRADLMGLAAAAYLMLATAVTRNPKLAAAGALAASLLAGAWRSPAPDALHWAVQAGLVFYLLHSLRWREHEHSGAAVARLLTAVAWVAHAFCWVRGDAPFWLTPALAAFVVAVCGLHWWIRQKRVPVVILLAAALVALSCPIHMLLVVLRATPVGLIAVGASFLLFGLGTLAAVTKPRWCPTPAVTQS